MQRNGAGRGAQLKGVSTNLTSLRLPSLCYRDSQANNDMVLLIIYYYYMAVSQGLETTEFMHEFDWLESILSTV